MRKFLVPLIALLALSIFPTASAWTIQFQRPLSAGPFQTETKQLEGGLVQFSVLPDGNVGEKCASIIYDSRLWPDGITISETFNNEDAFLSITISVPLPIINKFLCCSFDETIVNQKLASCFGTKDCCGAACNQCCVRYTLDECWLADTDQC